jgi:SAM-dependent methyltransferase
MDTKVDSCSPYDAVAGLYHAMWANWYLPAARPALESLFFSKLSAGSRVLDLCCGCGHVTGELVRRGYQVTGVDSSAALIALAREELPEVEFRIKDVRTLALEREFDGVLSTFDSLNHILSLKELGEVFTGVRGVLSPGGLLVFDMNLEEAYLMDLREWTVHVDEASVGLVRGTYDIGTKLATTELIWFVRRADGLWRQHRSSVEQRCYPQQEILIALAEAGFSRMEAIDAAEAGMRSDLACGRVFFVARS